MAFLLTRTAHLVAHLGRRFVDDGHEVRHVDVRNLPAEALLPLATGGSPAHVLAVDYALRPVLTSLGAEVAHGWFVLDRHIGVDADRAVTLAPEAHDALTPVVERFRAALPGRSRLAAA
ncbi:hypothetical protein [Streptomyces sp. LaPpAH-108]|uniref:hypothetical protein n=1 Tax=Streptomyces sp. LaPpAH-108 TaxID=1155714 RepID=UPI000370E9B2|nr:hypothetical protein [Streptomyces sp. LaPpAH-108]